MLIVGLLMVSAAAFTVSLFLGLLVTGLLLVALSILWDRGTDAEPEGGDS